MVLGTGGVALGFPPADPIIGLLITVAILFVLRDAAKEVFRRLMDAVDPATVEAALTVGRAHRIAHDVEHALQQAVPRLTAAVVHTEPSTGAEAAHEPVAPARR